MHTPGITMGDPVTNCSYIAMSAPRHDCPLREILARTNSLFGFGGGVRRKCMTGFAGTNDPTILDIRVKF
jgi:hypothetical protein